MVIEMNYSETMVFGLDIGTRSIVGTVGYKQGDKFHVVAHCVREHETRAMIDGQIHDIGKVGEAVKQVKRTLEEAVGHGLEDVCIAAAGRVLRTVTVHVDEEFAGEHSVAEDDIFALNTKGVEKAYSEFFDSEKEDGDINFYCVGYQVIRYYLNGYPIGNLEEHNARTIGADIIATFLPEDVVDGLYKAVAIAGLNVVNITLEPIAAISLAIPESYRMLNIALVDVGAGTSDISVTKDGTIAAFGMIPVAGDAITEAICQGCLVDFNTADKIKRDAEAGEDVVYKDIIGIEHSISQKELDVIVQPVIEAMTKQVSDKIKELNGDKAVSAVFVVGGGGRIKGYTGELAKQLGIMEERVAIRGKEVMGNVVFHKDELEVDSLLVTPIGICLSFYEQNNNFIYVTFNGASIKLYDNGKTTVIDAAMQAQFSNEELFPRRGEALNFFVGGSMRMARGYAGESAIVTVNGMPADVHTPIKDRDRIKVISSTAGEAASLLIGQLPEYGTTMKVCVNGQNILLPRFAQVNGMLQSEFYSIQQGDEIEMLDYYTVRQVAEFADIPLEPDMNIYVNNKAADEDTRVYSNFDVVWGREAIDADEIPENSAEITEEEKSDDVSYVSITVRVNDKEIALFGKKEYVFVDVFEYIDFDLSTPGGRTIITKLNGNDAQYMENIKSGDVLEIYWDKRN